MDTGLALIPSIENLQQLNFRSWSRYQTRRLLVQCTQCEENLSTFYPVNCEFCTKDVCFDCFHEHQNHCRPKYLCGDETAPVTSHLQLAHVLSLEHRSFLESLHLNRESDRLATFSLWLTQPLRPTPVDLARAGFFYLGDLDRTQCFYCGGVLRNWTSDDVALIEHQTHFPNCAFICGTDTTNIPCLTTSDGQVENHSNTNQKLVSKTGQCCSSKELSLTLHRQDGLFGFSVIGKKALASSIRLDDQIVISKVTKDGAADQAGVKVADELVAIGERYLHGVECKAAVEILKNCGETVDIVVQRAHCTESTQPKSVTPMETDQQPVSLQTTQIKELAESATETTVRAKDASTQTTQAKESAEATNTTPETGGETLPKTIYNSTTIPVESTCMDFVIQTVLIQ